LYKNKHVRPELANQGLCIKVYNFTGLPSSSYVVRKPEYTSHFTKSKTGLHILQLYTIFC